MLCIGVHCICIFFIKDICYKYNLYFYNRRIKVIFLGKKLSMYMNMIWICLKNIY